MESMLLRVVQPCVSVTGGEQYCSGESRGGGLHLIFLYYLGVSTDLSTVEVDPLILESVLLMCPIGVSALNS